MKILLTSFTMIFLSTAQAQPQGPNKTIYGRDNRVSPQDHPDEKLRDLSKYVVVLKQPMLLFMSQNYCSGFLVSHNSKSYVITAGHCLKGIGCNFSVKTKHEKNSDNNETYKCSKIIHNSQSPDYGMAEIRRENKKDKTPIPGLPLSFVKAEVGDELAIIGHPEGKKMKIADNCQVGVTTPTKFYHNCDTFSGNSGSMTINISKDYALSGVLVAGREDFTPDGKLNVLSESVFGESSTDLSVIFPSLVTE